VTAATRLGKSVSPIRYIRYSVGCHLVGAIAKPPTARVIKHQPKRLIPTPAGVPYTTIDFKIDFPGVWQTRGVPPLMTVIALFISVKDTTDLEMC
jgi:hypothetical protein